MSEVSIFAGSNTLNVGIRHTVEEVNQVKFFMECVMVFP